MRWCLYLLQGNIGCLCCQFINLSEYIISEASIQNNKGYIIVVYISPSQDAIEFQNFLSNFETILSDTRTNNALFTIILGDLMLDLQSGRLMTKPQLKA